MHTLSMIGGRHRSEPSGQTSGLACRSHLRAVGDGHRQDLGPQPGVGVVAHRRVGIVVVEVPIRGAAQQVTFECRIPVMEVVAEEGTEVTVVAIPPAGTIDRRDEHRVAVEAIEHGLTR